MWKIKMSDLFRAQHKQISVSQQMPRVLIVIDQDVCSVGIYRCLNSESDPSTASSA